MKAIVFMKYGSLDALQVRDVPEPVLRDNDVLVRVRASSINSWDWEYFNGVPFINRLMFGLFKPNPDRWHHLPPQELHAREEALKRVNAAYDVLRRQVA